MSSNKMMAGSFAKTYQTVAFGAEAQKELLKGANILYQAVKSTMGPSGHNVIIDNEVTSPTITKDGVTVARSINLKEKLPSIGAELLKEIAAKTNELAGDGTSTATVLGYEMLSQGIKMVATGRSAIGIKRGMDLATTHIIDRLKEMAIKVRDTKDIINVGTISANGDRTIGELLAQAIEKVGEDGIITIEPAKSVLTTLEVVEGMQIDSGYNSPYFVTNSEKLTCELQEPLVLITNKKLTSLPEILPALEIAANQSKPLLIIGDEIDGEVLHALIVNKMKGTLFSCAIKAPSYGENRTDLLNDIALVTGGTVFDSSSELSLKNIQAEHFGVCKKIIVTRNSSTFVGEGGEERKLLLEQRVHDLKSLLSNDKTLDDLKRNNLKKRLAKLAGGIAVVKVGGSTEVEIMEKKDRVEDSLNATIAAVQEGILPGGGIALFYAAQWFEESLNSKVRTTIESEGNKVILPKRENLNEDEWAGVKVVIEACKQPLRVIVENTGKSADVVINTLTTAKIVYNSEDFTPELHYNGLKFKPSCFGYDAYKHEYCDMIEAGVCDTLKVERFSLLHACSVVGLTLSCNAIVINEKQEETGAE